MKKARIIAVLLILMIAPACHAQQRVLLRYKYHLGDVYSYKMTGVGAGDIIMRSFSPVAQKQTMPLKLTVDTTYSMKVESIDPQGNADILMTFGPLRTVTEVAGKVVVSETDLAQGTVTVDGVSQPLPQQMRDLMQGGLRAKMSPLGQLISMENLGKFSALMQMSGLSGINFTDLMKQTGPQLPEGPVAIGDVWQQGIRIGPQAAVTARAAPSMKAHYALANIEPASETATMLISGRFLLPAQKTAMVKVPQGSLTTRLLGMAEDVRGSIFFDYGRGMLSGADMLVTLNMRSKMDTTGMVNGVEITSSSGMQMHNLKLSMKMELQK